MRKTWLTHIYEVHIDGLVQDCSNSIANALELLQSCTKPSTYGLSQITKGIPLDSPERDTNMVLLQFMQLNYCNTSSTSRTKSQNLNASCLFLQWSLTNPVKPGVKLRMKM